MLTEKDLIIINYSKEREVAAEYFAIQRVFFENRTQDISSITDENIDRVKLDCISEFAFLEYLSKELDRKFSKGEIKWDVGKKYVGLHYLLRVGIYKTGYRGTLAEKTIQVKTERFSKNSLSELFKSNGTPPFKIHLDTIQYPKPDLYVHSLVLDNNDIALSGYLNQNGISSVAINELKKISSLTEEF